MSREVHGRFWERLEREITGINLDRSTLAEWVGKSTALLEPLAGRLPKARSWLRHKDQTAPAASWNPGMGNLKG